MGHLARLAAVCLVVAVIAVCAWSAVHHNPGPALPIPTTDNGTSERSTTP